MAKNLILWVTIAFVLMMVFNNFGSKEPSVPLIDYSKFINDVGHGQVREVVIDGDTIKGTTQNGENFITYNPDDKGLIGDLLKNNVKISSPLPNRHSLLVQIFISWFPTLLLLGILIFFMRQIPGGGGGLFSFIKSPAKPVAADQVKVTFADVAGVDEAKEEVAELVEFLRDPGKFQNLGDRKSVV